MSRYRYPAGRAQSNRNRLPPPRIDGHLYYVRLRTEIGLIYKLGFTTQASIEDRLAFKGDGAEKLIDKVLFFHHFSNAWELEQELHTLFDPDKLFSGGTCVAMPLYKNGQSELYGDDILQLDQDYSEQQLADVQDNIVVLDMTRFGTQDASEIRAEIAERRANERARAEDRAKRKAAADNYEPGLGMRALVMVLKPLILLLSWGASGLLSLMASPNPPKPQRNVQRIMELRTQLQDLRRIQRN